MLTESEEMRKNLRQKMKRVLKFLMEKVKERVSKGKRRDEIGKSW